MIEEEIESALIDVMIRTLDGWLILHPAITHDAVLAWMESVNVECDCETETETPTEEWQEVFE